VVVVVAVDGVSCRRRCDFVRAPVNGRVLASVVTMETGCGGPDCPWLVTVEDGQRVNITLVNFARSYHHDDDDDDEELDTANDARDCKVRYERFVTYTYTYYYYYY